MATDEYVHLFAGGLGGTVGSVVTCPFEVVKTRLQSSVATFQPPPREPLPSGQYQPKALYSTCSPTSIYTTASRDVMSTPKQTANPYYCIRHIIQHEGVRGLFKGLGPNLMGVAPSRALYFYAYAHSKKFLNARMTPETRIVHFLSAMNAGIITSTLTNPIWFVKTRLQLDQKRNSSLTAWQCTRKIYRKNGIRGLYKGISASYFGVSETVIYFVIYEAIKAKLREHKGTEIYEEQRSLFDFMEFAAAAATSKTIATCVAYPHEVVRTRLREEGTKYRRFIQTLVLVAKEEGTRGVYRGLVTQLVRQIPNTAATMVTYEAVVHLWYKYS